ncbi:chromosome-associated kinesin KIF4 [Drosophila grimshawi]|uniref:chromosome-associated kinesin KIF4 n=1 Tax=Drosophila grimshawi TaxID=7222 RepID=UPI001C935465|nr:chromosome-associated kinesin KIF4 [Drosophila grimshawi]
MTDSVAVALRLRPLVKSEEDRGCRMAVQRPDAGVPQVIVNNKAFTYNYVFDCGDSQEDVYETCVASRLKKLLDGFNLTILAYGQTGSGKTYTMGTAFNGSMGEHAGIIPRAVNEIFEKTVAMAEQCDFRITCSFVELYQEQFYDLFSPNRREDSIVDIREDKNGIFMRGLTEVEVTGAKQVASELMRGSSGRAVASTAMNESSSRSHAIFTLSVVAKQKTGQKSVIKSKFHLVDLAGSERCAKTMTSGDRFKEGVNINKGLLALGNVINVLGSGESAAYVPYRQSKLTRWLQESLGGNSITLMIACVSPADYNVAETISTLQYADRALQIKNKPVVNVDPHVAEVMMLKETVQKLRIELLARGADSGSVGAGVENGSGLSRNSALENQRISEQLQEAKQHNRQLQKELQEALLNLADKEMQAHITEVNHDKVKASVLELMTKLGEAQQLSMEGQEQGGEQHLRDVVQLVSGVDEELKQTEIALQTHRKECLTAGASSSSSVESNLGSSEEINEHTTKQLDLNVKLRQINSQLDLKQELHDRVALNFRRLDEEGNDEKLKEYQVKVEQLESERRELMEQLRITKQKEISAKLAEERRKRLQLLEHELTDMRRKIVQQGNMLKMREKESEKIKNLSTEIRAMKESKVKLIRAMREESERFRQSKMLSEKQMTQLKSKDRKMQSELVRQKNLYDNQRLVLKRKCEDAMAVNKRLKDALERQRSAQAQRQRHAKNQTADAGKLDALMDREVEVILSLVDAEHSLEQLMEDRAAINAQCMQIKERQEPDQEEAAYQASQLASLEEELEMRNAQIADLQQKVCFNDLDSRLSAVCENVHSLGEARVISSKVLKMLVQQRREQAQCTMERMMLLHHHKEASLRIEKLTEQFRIAECRYEQQMLNEKRSYEEKMAMLLRGGDLAQQQIVEELLSSKEALQQQLDLLTSKANLSKKHKKGAGEDKYAVEAVGNESLLNISDESIEDNNMDSDPDWVPAKKRSKKSNSLRQPCIDSDTSNPNPIASTNSNIKHTANSSRSNTSTNNKSNSSQLKHCSCTTSCSSKRCGCYSAGNSCNDYCKCRDSCQNPVNKENAMPNTSVPDEKNGGVLLSSPKLVASSSPCSPSERTCLKLPRNLQLHLDTPSVKEKFF